jgi:hypothetical protein
MHDTALALGRLVLETNCGSFMGGSIADLGALSVNGFLRALARMGISYIGIDMSSGPGVDIVAHDPDILPLADDSVDGIVSYSRIEHAEHFWQRLAEAQRPRGAEARRPTLHQCILKRTLSPLSGGLLAVPFGCRPRSCTLGAQARSAHGAARILHRSQRG